jgi:hypothetical protein
MNPPHAPQPHESLDPEVKSTLVRVVSEQLLRDAGLASESEYASNDEASERPEDLTTSRGPYVSDSESSREPSNDATQSGGRDLQLLSGTRGAVATSQIAEAEPKDEMDQVQIEILSRKIELQEFNKKLLAIDDAVREGESLLHSFHRAIYQRNEEVLRLFLLSPVVRGLFWAQQNGICAINIVMSRPELLDRFMAHEQWKAKQKIVDYLLANTVLIPPKPLPPARFLTTKQLYQIVVLVSAIFKNYNLPYPSELINHIFQFLPLKSIRLVFQDAESVHRRLKQDVQKRQASQVAGLMSNSAEDRTNAISELLSLSEESKSIDSAAAESKSRQVDSEANEEENPSDDEALVTNSEDTEQEEHPRVQHLIYVDLPGQELKTFGDLRKMLIANGFDAGDVSRLYVVPDDTTQGNEIYPHVERDGEIKWSDDLINVEEK